MSTLSEHAGFIRSALRPIGSLALFIDQLIEIEDRARSCSFVFPRVGIGGHVGFGKTALTLALCRSLRERYQIAVVTNDIYTEEDAKFLVTHEALTSDRINGVETGGCPAHRDSRGRVDQSRSYLAPYHELQRSRHYFR